MSFDIDSQFPGVAQSFFLCKTLIRKEASRTESTILSFFFNDFSENPVPSQVIQHKLWRVLPIDSSVSIPSSGAEHRGRESCVGSESITVQITAGREGLSCFHEVYQALSSTRAGKEFCADVEHSLGTF